MVVDPSDVLDLAGPLGHAQDEVPVLGTVVAGSEAAHLLDERPAGHAEVARVHLRAEPLGRPVWLQEGVVADALLVDLVLVRVEVVDLGVGADGQVDRFEGTGVELVVVVEEGHELAGGHVEGVVRGGDDPAGLGAVPDLDAFVAGRRLLEHGPYVRLGGAVVDDAELPVRVRLVDDGPDGGAQHVRVWVVDGRDDGEAGGAHDGVAQRRRKR